MIRYSSILRMLTALTALIVILALDLRPSYATVPSLLSFQGRITDSLGVPLPDGLYSIEFSIYDNIAGGQVVWSETQSDLQVKSGLVSTLLGSVNPMDDQVFAGENRWLAISVDDGAELLPRTQLASVGYAQRVGTVDGAKGGSMLGDLYLDDSLSAEVIAVRDYLFVANGVSSQNLAVRNEMHVGGSAAIDANLVVGDQSVVSSDISNIYLGDLAGDDGTRGLVLRAGDASRLYVAPDGNVGIGIQTPPEALSVSGSVSVGADLIVGGQRVLSASPSYITVGDLEGGDGTRGLDFRAGDATIVHITPAGAVGVGTQDPTARLDVEGTTKTCVLEITGGCDLAEPFEISDPNSPPPGALVVIDELRPGKLKLSISPYDPRVAGIVSGAGGIKPGLTLSQRDQSSIGELVAMTGRVYALATALNGPIEPGDRLTTSSIPGHAMKVTDNNRAIGAVIGKAMSRLDSGDGLVLVLVQPQ